MSGTTAREYSDDTIFKVFIVLYKKRNVKKDQLGDLQI
jgi:hypothetical protein